VFLFAAVAAAAAVVLSTVLYLRNAKVTGQPAAL
jgi:hypothetical protein